MNRRQPAGMRGFTVVWLGQVVSMLGTGLTQFAITIWAWQVTGEATALALVGFFTFTPTVLLSPVAGAIVDRANRKLVMMASDLAAGLATIAILLLYTAGQLEVWHLYVAGAFSGAFSAFQFPAYSAAITTMVPKRHYARASGMLALAGSMAGIAAPALAGLLLGVIGIGGIMVIDIATFVMAIAALLLVHVPQPEITAEGAAARGSLWQESLFGFRYILGRPSLLGLQLVFFGINLIATFAFILLAPLVLARTGNDELALGTVQAAMGVGGVAGGLLLASWGGPARRVHGVLGGMMLASLTGQLVIGAGNGLAFWATGGFFTALWVPLLNGSNQAIWQAKVEPDVQGRVFAARRLIAQVTAPLAMLLAGPLADDVFEPAMAVGGRLADTFAWLEPGPGAGMSLMFVLTGLAGFVVGLGGYAVRIIREVEDILPDHEAVDGGDDDAPGVREQTGGSARASVETEVGTPGGTAARWIARGWLVVLGARVAARAALGLKRRS